MIKVTSEVRSYEHKGKEHSCAIDPPMLVVKSHWNYNDRVVIQWPGSDETYTFLRKDLLAAVINATNTERF